MVIAGMEGALPSVVGGHVACPVIGVPTLFAITLGVPGPAAVLLDAKRGDMVMFNPLYIHAGVGLGEHDVPRIAGDRAAARDRVATSAVAPYTSTSAATARPDVASTCQASGTNGCGGGTPIPDNHSWSETGGS